MTDVVDLGPLIAGGTATPSPDPALSVTLAQGHPIVLLPVRVETRYADLPSGGRELLVRIWPDQVHIDAHDPRLTAAEADAGRQFWLAEWRCGDDQDRRRRAWSALAERFDPTRAAWIARATRPENAAARPTGAVADTEPPRVQPVFGTVPLTERPSPPVARLLPAAWTATAYAGGHVVAVATGRPITVDPAVGPDVDAPLVHPALTGPEADEVAAIDTGMHWLVDFDAAEDIGMALRLPVDGPVDLLLVTGVRGGRPEDGAEGLAALLDAQRFTAGLGAVAPGTLTNNTADSPAGWSSADLGSLGAGDLSADPSTRSLARALGLAGTDLAGLPGAGDDDDALISAVSRTLWPATWGYWLTQFVGLGVGGLDDDGLAWAREHAAAYLRPGGPWPTLRIGRQPYGLLPATALTRFRGDARETRLGAIVAGLIATGWRPALGRAARVGRGDPATDLVDVLRLSARSDTVSLRRALGPTFAANALDFLARGVPADAWRALAARTQALTGAVGLPSTITGALLLYEPTAWPVDLPLVGDDHTTALHDLLAADVDAVAAAIDERPPSLLAALVRQGWLREHADAAVRLIGDAAVSPAHDPELFGFAGSTLGWSAQRARSVGADTVRARLATGGDPAAADIEAFRAAALVVAAASPDMLAPRVAETLDAASHRVDAWATSLATRRLAELRADLPSGVLVGGYGWVEALAPEPGEAVVEPVPGEPSLRQAIDDPGFLHTPSIHQAEVAALLRNAHLTHGGGDDDPFAITITSQRVRLAQRIFDGVRAGRSLGAVLGYLVERDLHERGLDASIDNAREVSPLPGQELLPIAARRLDGLSLHKLWSDSEDHAIDHLVAGSQDATLRRKAAGVLRRLGVAVDAAADLLQAEQVHHMVRGNLTAAVNTLGDIDRGLAPPPDLDLIRTPRTGITVTHRVAVVLAADAAPAGGWAEATGSPWAGSEPALDAWFAQCLGPVSGHRLTVVGQDAPEHPVELADLGLTATDLVSIAGAGESGVAELSARAARAIPGPRTRASLRADRDVLDLLELGRSLAGLVAAGRPLDGSKLQPPHADPRPGIDLDELTERVARAEALVRSAVATLDAALAGADPMAVDAALAHAWGFHLGGTAVPEAVDEASLRAAAARARAALQTRLDQAGAIMPSDDQLATVQQHLGALLGPGFVALPRFLPPDADDLVSSRDDPALVGDDPLVAQTWLMRLERVREPLMRLGVALRESAALGGVPMRLGVAQTPHRPGAAWNGRPAATYLDGAASLVLVGADVLAPGRPIAGLLVDELTELVPSATETTGVAFRYETPTATAPQALLLAVPPVIGEEWTAGGLNQVLLETLDLAHVRALAPDEVDLVRQFLPAAMLAFNTDGDVASTNPNALH